MDILWILWTIPVVIAVEGKRICFTPNILPAFFEFRTGACAWTYLITGMRPGKGRGGGGGGEGGGGNNHFSSPLTCINVS